MKFYLGTHHPDWIGRARFPLFVSHRRMRSRKTFPRALSSWALDSGAFSEITLNGTWETSPHEYASRVEIYREEVGRMDFAATQDWMCEPHMLRKTGLSIDVHQRRTTQSYLDLREIDDRTRWLPTLQGWIESDYMRHLEHYSRYLRIEDTLFGVGSICKRQGTQEIERLLGTLRATGIRIHGFGVKTQGFRRYASLLHSSDSMAWSYHARRAPILLDECVGVHINCANCITYARKWRSEVLRAAR